MKKLITGNEAIALGALSAGVKVVTGYPGTPSTGCLASLLPMDLPGREVQWSVNEKVAIEIAGAAAWAGQRALCTMKMSGLNVAYDSFISLAQSGCDGGFVVYVADDPGANAGMVEQDTREFAIMADVPMLEPASVEEAYRLTRYAFELSEQIKGPVFLRTVTAIADSFAEVEVDPPTPPAQIPALLVRDINRYTKAGAIIAMTQHREILARLEQANQIITADGINTLTLGSPGGLGIIACGIAAAYLEEGFDAVMPYGLNRSTISILVLKNASPFPASAVRELLHNCQQILVLEELEPLVERGVFVEAQRMGWDGQIIGKLDGPFSRVGEYGVAQVVQGLASALALPVPAHLLKGRMEAPKLAAARPITVCAGCPHRGTYMAIEKAIRKLKLKKADVMVTGDIGCTILGMNPPFDIIWNEVSMGASLGVAQGYVFAGVKNPVIATIGDSTFFHAGIAGLINAVQHKTDLTLIIMDNSWTAMTGMQINPGTPCSFSHKDYAEIDIARIIPALGVEHFWTVDPFDLDATTAAIADAMRLPGVKVVLARQECAIQAQRAGKSAGTVRVVEENCNLCKLCLMVTGCSAITLGEKAIAIDPELCYGCMLCAETCNRAAIVEVGAL